LTTSATTTSDAIVSARVKPVVTTTIPAMAVAMNPNRSVRRCGCSALERNHGDLDAT
jgi:hypothetical protein